MASKLLRLLRLPRLMRLLKMGGLVKLIDLCLYYSSRSDKVTTRHTCLFVLRIFRTLFIALMLTYFLGCFWHFICRYFNSDEDADTFINVYLRP